MSTTTLEQIKATHAKLAEQIAALERTTNHAAQAVTLVLPQAHIELQPGERYAGAIVDDAGAISHHLILLPGSIDTANWQAATAWAQAQGGTLPNRREQALLYANLKAEFQPTWYWSCEVHKDDGAYAWYQDFDDGGQYYSHSSYEGCARAVRRFTA